MRRALLVLTAGHTDVQLLEGEARHELDKDYAGPLHAQLASRTDWTLADSKPKGREPRSALPEGPFQLCTPKLDEILRYLDDHGLQLAHALILHTDRPPHKRDPAQAGPILQRRLHEREHSSIALVSYMSGGDETLEDTTTAGDEIIRREVVTRLDSALAAALAHPPGPFDVVVLATTGGLPKVQALVEELARLRAAPLPCTSLEVADAKRDLAERAIPRSPKTDPSVVVAATRHALALVERGDFIAAWGAVAHLAPPQISPVFRWLYEWATSMPHEPGKEPPADFPLPRADQRALAAALRVELALRHGDIAHAIHKTFAFFEAAIWDLLHRDHIQGPHAPDAPLSFVLHPPPLDDAEGNLKPEAKHPGHHRVKNYGIGSFEIRKRYLAKHTPSTASIAPLKAFADAVGQVEDFRNMIAHGEPQRARLGAAREKMGQLRLWSRKRVPSITTQPLFQDVLAALGAPALADQLGKLLAATRAYALASWRSP